MMSSKRPEVVAGACSVPGVAIGIEPDARPGRRLVGGDRAAAGLDTAVGTKRLHVDAQLHCRAAWCRRLGRQAEVAQPRATGDQQLQPHEVEVGDLFRHRVLDLQARIGFDEGERRVVHAGRDGDQELDGGQPLEPGGLCHAQGGVEQLVAHGRIEARRRRDLDQLLSLALQAALALPEMTHRAGAVAYDLHFNVPRPREELLGIQPTVAERRRRLGGATLERRRELACGVDWPHAAAAATGDGLEHDRAAGAKLLEEGTRLVHCRGAWSARNHRHGARLGERAGADLVAEQVERVGLRPDEGDAGGMAGARQGSVLGEEAVAGMHGVASFLLRRAHDGVDVEIGCDTGAGDHAHRIRLASVQRTRVIGRMDRDSRDPHVGGGAGNTDRDLATVGDQQAFNRHRSPRYYPE
jgi:hypothetical protein